VKARRGGDDGNHNGAKTLIDDDGITCDCSTAAFVTKDNEAKESARDHKLSVSEREA
jgi:hypothetical protein